MTLREALSVCRGFLSGRYVSRQGLHTHTLSCGCDRCRGGLSAAPAFVGGEPGSSDVLTEALSVGDDVSALSSGALTELSTMVASGFASWRVASSAVLSSHVPRSTPYNRWVEDRLALTVALEEAVRIVEEAARAELERRAEEARAAARGQPGERAYRLGGKGGE